jgi:hypothetical protein
VIQKYENQNPTGKVNRGLFDILHHLKEMDSFDFNKPGAVIPHGFLLVPAADH